MRLCALGSNRLFCLHECVSFRHIDSCSEVWEANQAKNINKYDVYISSSDAPKIITISSIIVKYSINFFISLSLLPKKIKVKKIEQLICASKTQKYIIINWGGWIWIKKNVHQIFFGNFRNFFFWFFHRSFIFPFRFYPNFVEYWFSKFFLAVFEAFEIHFLFTWNFTVYISCRMKHWGGVT